MKKTLKIALLAVCMLCLLTGCYEQSSVISVNPLGGIKAEIAFVGNDEGIGQIAGGASFADLQQSLLPQIKGLVTDVSKEKVEEVSLDAEGDQYKGIKVTGYYSDLNDMYSSPLMSTFNSHGFVPAPVIGTDLEEAQPGVSLKEDKGFLGTSYKAYGSISMTQGTEVDAEQKAAMSKCAINLKFKFPVGAFTFSKGNSNFIMPTFKYEVTMENDNAPVEFSVFLPNYLGILGALIFIGLIVAVVLMAKKIKELQAIINGEVVEAVAEENADNFVSEDDANFFEGSEETVEIQEPAEDATEENTEE